MTPEMLSQEVELIVIGCSAGGFAALGQILGELPKKIRIPIVIVIHQSVGGRAAVSELFASIHGLSVKEAEDKEPIESGHIYFAPADYHLSIEKDQSFCLSQEERVNFSRPSIDVFFESAAIAYRERVLGVILTGANMDGANGLKQIIELGGKGIVQDPKTAEHATMPEAALKATQPQAVLPLDRLALWLKTIQTGERNGST